MKNPILFFPTGIKGAARRRRRLRGQTLVEYAMIIGFIAIVAVGCLYGLEQQTGNLYTKISSAMSQVNTSH
jgi:Flp pilus assembly pilin Flp